MLGNTAAGLIQAFGPLHVILFLPLSCLPSAALSNKDENITKKTTTKRLIYYYHYQSLSYKVHMSNMLATLTFLWSCVSVNLINMSSVFMQISGSLAAGND